MELIRAKVIAIVDDNVYTGINKYIKKLHKILVCLVYILHMRTDNGAGRCRIYVFHYVGCGRQRLVMSGVREIA